MSEDKKFWLIMSAFFSLIVLILYLLVVNSIAETKECHEKGGILIKESSGWVCIKAERVL